MNILILGSGGREHALAWKIAASPLCGKLYCVPGNAGIAQVAECAGIDLADHKAVIAYARDKMIAGSDYFSTVSPHTHVPVRALVLSGIVAAAIVCLGLFFQNAIATIVNSAIIGIYAAFQMIVLGAAVARVRG